MDSYKNYGSLTISFKDLGDFVNYARELNQYLKEDLGTGLKVPNGDMKMAEGLGSFKGKTIHEADLENYLDAVEEGEEDHSIVRSGSGYELKCLVDSITNGTKEMYKFKSISKQLENLEERVEKLKKKGFDVDLEKSKENLEKRLEEQQEKVPDISVDLFATYNHSNDSKEVVPVSLFEVRSIDKDGKTKKVLDKVFSISKGYKGLPLLEDAVKRLRTFKRFYRNPSSMPEIKMFKYCFKPQYS